MTPREKQTVAAISKHLRDEWGAVLLKTSPATGRAGLPDLVACVRGRFVAVEVKAPGAARGATRLQRHTLDRIVAAGGIGIVADSVEQVDDALHERVIEPVLIARCPDHGLHGERDECFVCGGPVERVPMIAVSE